MAERFGGTKKFIQFPKKYDIVIPLKSNMAALTMATVDATSTRHVFLFQKIVFFYD